ncbi:GNAT family N-acetyltransferase [Actinopolymorpha singaporensis]|uniref:Protein N-acetyltransferase, RimJ/RimL family n=1 Tax=Actinopolymorpha singaporensis TaxID=117157 RepID=A0A1H1T6Z0_9ACTN|nr:GNAT family protein [Actinopolymorpha singaporensis]SDS55726.1 Protein N-acetyltransferase, RimJ/RimL family [Actinopolymorpha singaporensis]
MVQTSAAEPGTAEHGASEPGASEPGASEPAHETGPAPADRWFETPVLSGDHVRLEPMSLAHAEGLAAAADDQVFEHLRIRQVPRTREEGEAFVRAVLAQRDRRVLLPWTQVDAVTGEVAGTTSYYEVDPDLRTVAIGHTWLGRRWWRTGVNTEAKLLLLRRAFDDLGAVRVVWHTDLRNERSQAAIARLGAQREGVLRKHRLRRDGSWRDTVQFAMTDDDWPQVRDRLSARLRPAAC